MSEVRTPEIENTIVAGIADGTPLRQLCRMHGIGKSSVYRWMEDDADFAGRIARARVEGFDAIADETMEIADNKEEDPASRRVRIETRLKLLAKWDPKRYGDLVKLAGADGSGPVAASLTVAFVRPGEQRSDDAG